MTTVGESELIGQTQVSPSFFLAGLSVNPEERVLKQTKLEHAGRQTYLWLLQTYIQGRPVHAYRLMP
jgi:hypothetical protein